MSKPILCLDTHELVWAAGFFDGEGTIIWRGQKRKELSLSVSQSDAEPLERFRRAVGGLGSLCGPYHHRNNRHKPYWVISTNGFPDTQAIIAFLWRWLSGPKRRQAEQCLLAARPYYRSRYEGGKGRALLTREQVKTLRQEHAAAKQGRERVPRGWITDAARRYGVKPDTIGTICGGRGYE